MAADASLAALVVLILVPIIIVRFFTKFVPNNMCGIVEKTWSRLGSLQDGRVIAMHGESGFEARVLRGGRYFLNSFQYRVHLVPLVTIAPGHFGIVFARDGRPLTENQALASNVRASNFADVIDFLTGERDTGPVHDRADGVAMQRMDAEVATGSGQRGTQRKLLRAGTYAINLAQFVVLTQERAYFLSTSPREDATYRAMHQQVLNTPRGFTPLVIDGKQDLIGIVTVQEGPSLPSDELIAPTVGADPDESSTYHDSFQDPEKFLRAGGFRGRQNQVLMEGTYYINPLFASVELVPKTVIEVGNCGVVVSYTGKQSRDISGDDYKHGELVEPGFRGVWGTPLMTGKYAFNTFAGKIVIVPTTNIILKWNTRESGEHNYDENLQEISLITKDAFEPLLPLSVVIHMDYRVTPYIVQRFGDIKVLVEQSLDPLVAAYFKNIGQTRTLIELIQQRAEIQDLAGKEMRSRFGNYNLELVEVLIGTPRSPPGDTQIERILDQLRARQVAREKVETYEKQQQSAHAERHLKEAQARAAQQQSITESEVAIVVQRNVGVADLERSKQEAARIKCIAEAEAAEMTYMAEANAERVARVGVAESVAIEEQVRAYGGPKFKLTQQVMEKFTDAIGRSGVDIVPRVVFGGGGEGVETDQGKALQSMLTLMMATNVSKDERVTGASMLGITAGDRGQTALSSLARGPPRGAAKK